MVHGVAKSRTPPKWLSTALEDVRIGQLIPVTDPCSMLQTQGGYRRVIITCFMWANLLLFAFPITRHGLHCLQFKDTPLWASWWKMELRLCFFHFPPALCPLPVSKLHFFSLKIALWMKPSLHVKTNHAVLVFSLKILETSMEESLSHPPCLIVTNLKKTSQWQNWKPQSLCLHKMCMLERERDHLLFLFCGFCFFFFSLFLDLATQHAGS